MAASHFKWVDPPAKVEGLPDRLVAFRGSRQVLRACFL